MHINNHTFAQEGNTCTCIRLIINMRLITRSTFVMLTNHAFAQEGIFAPNNKVCLTTRVYCMCVKLCTMVDKTVYIIICYRELDKTMSDMVSHLDPRLGQVLVEMKHERYM